MKAAIIGAKLGSQWDDIIQRVKEVLDSKQCNVDMSYFSSSTDEDASDLEGAFRRNKQLIKTSDFIVAETTQYSSGIGYLIADAIHHKKPVLALYNKTLGDKPSNIIKSSVITKQLIFLEYTDSNLAEGIVDFLKKVKSMVDTKFILQLPAEIDQYLEWASFHNNVPKSQVVRDAIISKMKKNPEWKDYLEGSASTFEL